MSEFLTKFLFLVLVAIFVTPLQAEIIGPTTIDYVRSYEDYALIRVSDSGQNTDNCTHPSARRLFYIQMKNGQGKVLFVTALSAYLANSSVKIDGRSCLELNNRTLPKVFGIHMFSE